MDYAPFQAWVRENVIKTPSVFMRPRSKLTDYDPVMQGNLVPGEVDITDPGQLGRANLPSLHDDTNSRDSHVDAVLPAVDTLTSLLPRTARWVGLRGTQWNPFSFTDGGTETVTEYVATAGIAQMPFGMAGAGTHDEDISEHGPITVTELELAKNVRQPRNLVQRSFLRKLLFLPEKNYGPLGAHDERVIAQTGQADKDQDYLTDASVGVNNTFMLPDVRRTFDNPKDAPPGTPKDASGNPIMDKAGYSLTNTALEGSVHEIQTSHGYPNFSVMTERAIGDSGNRVRAGVQYDVQSTRPAVMPHWFDFRPFDKWAADGNLALKGQMKPRLISRPVMTSDDPGADVPWSAGRRFALPPAGMNPIGIHPNIEREPPQSWDSDAYLNVSSMPDYRAAGWRLSS